MIIIRLGVINARWLSSLVSFLPPASIYGVRLSLPLKSQLGRYRMQVLFTAAALAGQDLR